MQIFKKAKKDDSLDQRVRALEDKITTLRFEWDSLSVAMMQLSRACLASHDKSF